MKPVLRLLLQTSPHDPFERRADLRLRLTEFRRLITQNGAHHFSDRFTLKCAPPAQHLVENQPEGKDVCALVSLLPAHLFGRHIAYSAHHHTRIGQWLSVGASESMLWLSFCGFNFANPKSRILTRPSLVTNRFSGFRSRWTTPFSCAAAMPAAICCAYSIALRAGRAPSSNCARSSSPSSSSATMKGAPSWSPMS